MCAIALSSERNKGQHNALSEPYPVDSSAGPTSPQHVHPTLWRSSSRAFDLPIIHSKVLFVHLSSALPMIWLRLLPRITLGHEDRIYSRKHNCRNPLNIEFVGRAQGDTPLALSR